MTLYKLRDFHPNYKDEVFEGDDIKGLDVYAGDSDEKIGTVEDALVDEEGHFRYLIIDTGFWVFGKKVLLPIGRSRIDYTNHRVYATGITSKEQAEALPVFSDDMAIDYDYEENVRTAYRPTYSGSSVSSATDVASTLDTALTDTSAPLATDYTTTPDLTSDRALYADASTTAYDRDSYTYQQEPYLYDLNDRDHQKLRLYQERLIANKTRQKTGEVAVGKRVETEVARASVPIEKERIVVERSTPSSTEVVEPGAFGNFQEGEVARIEVYEETPDIRKEAFVREEVSIRKEVDSTVVDAEETLRREELDIKTDGNPVVNRRPDDIV